MPFFLLTNICSAGRYSAYYQRRKVNANPATNPLIYNSDLLARYTSARVAQSLWEQPNTLWLELNLTIRNRTHLQQFSHGLEPETRKGPMRKPSTPILLILLKEYSHEMTPHNIFLYWQISALLRHHKRNFFLQYMGRSTEAHSHEGETLLTIHS